MSPFPFTSTLDELYELLDEVTFNQVMTSLNNGDTVIFNHSGNTTSLRFGTPSTNGVFRTLHIDAASGKVDFDETFNTHPSSLLQREIRPETV